MSELQKWQQGKFSDVAEIIMGQSPDGSTYNQQGIGLPLLNGPTEFTQRYPRKIQWTTQPTKKCKKGDILLCVRGSSTGRINIADSEYCIGRGIATIRAKNGTSLSDYLEQQLIYGLPKILALTAGSTFPNIDKKSIGQIPIAIPNLKEQEKITEILATWDEALATTEKLIAAKQKRKKALMQKLLTGKFRFQQFASKKEEWLHGYFANVAEIVMGQSPDGSTYNQQGVGIPLLNGPTEFGQRYPTKIQWTTKPTKGLAEK